MDHSFAAVDDLSHTTSYQDAPIFSPNPFVELDREDFLQDADGIIQPDLSDSQLPPPTQTHLQPDHSFSPRPFDFDQLDFDYMLRDNDDSNGAQAQPDTADPAEDTGPMTAAAMEIAQMDEVNVDPGLQLQGQHQAGDAGPTAAAAMEMDEVNVVDPGLQLEGRPHPAGDVDAGPPTGTSMGKAPGELNSLETDGTGLKQPEPCSGNDTIDLSTATERDIIDHYRAWAEQRKDKEELPAFNDGLGHVEPWKFADSKGLSCYRATNMLDLDAKTRKGGCWKEADFRAVRPWGVQLTGLMRTLQFHRKDGTKTEWRMSEIIPVCVSDGHMILEGNVVERFVYISEMGPFKNYDSSRISGVVKEDNQHKGCTCTLHSDRLHHHHTVQNNQVHSPLGKRPRTNDDPNKNKLDVWRHFTRIYMKVSKEATGSSKNKKDGKKLIYAVCNYCDKVFKADSKQGTSHHGRHGESCLRKHSQPSSSKSCSQDKPRILESREIMPAGGCGSGMLCV